jgi:hypothetical protein
MKKFALIKAVAAAIPIAETQNLVEENPSLYAPPSTNMQPQTG